MNTNITDKNFIVIDDDAAAAKLMVDYLQSFGCTKINSFSNGKEALEFAEYHPVDFFICDWEMPGMDGLEVLRNVHKNPIFSRSIFIMVTSPASTEKLKVTASALNKVDSYLIKPFHPPALLEKLKLTMIDRAIDRKKSAMVVDDDESVRSLVTDILSQMNFDPIHQFERAPVALQFLQDHVDEIAFVISDWEMPEMSGLDFLHHVRTNEKTQHTPFVIITSQTSLEMLKIKQAVEAHVDYYLVKPFKVDTLQSKIHTLLKNVKNNAHIQLQLEIGRSSLAANDLHSAEVHFKNALSLDGKCFDALMGLAKVELGRRPSRGLNEGIAYLKEAVKIDPKSLNAAIELALAFEMALWPEQAVGALKEYIQHGPANVEAHYQLGRIMAKIGKIDDGIHELETAMKLSPHHSEAKLLLENAISVKQAPKKKA